MTIAPSRPVEGARVTGPGSGPSRRRVCWPSAVPAFAALMHEEPAIAVAMLSTLAARLAGTMPVS